MNNFEIQARTSVALKWSGLTEVLSRCVLPISSMILARVLTPDVFGVVAIVTMITSFADMLTDAGFQKYLIQHDFKDKNDLDKNTNVAFWTNLFLSISLWLLIFTFSKNLAILVGNKELSFVIIISSLSLPLTSFSSIQAARFKRDFNFKSLFFIKIVSVIVPFLITIPIAYLYKSYWALITGNLVIILLNAIILTCISSWKPKLYFSIKLLRKMFSYSWWILLESITVWMTSYIGTFIVASFLSEYYLGIYTTSMATVNQILSIIVATTSMPLFSALSRIKSDKNTLFRVYRNYIQAISIFVIPLGFGIWLYRDLITHILLGKQWMEATNFIGLWGLMSSFTLVLGTYCNGLFNAYGRPNLSFWAQILHLIILVPTIYISAALGYEILYIARSIVRIELIAVELILMKLCINFPIKKLITDIIPCFASALIMCLVGLTIKGLSESFLWQFSTIPICIIVYFGFIILFFHKILDNALDLFDFQYIKRFLA